MNSLLVSIAEQLRYNRSANDHVAVHHVYTRSITSIHCPCSRAIQGALYNPGFSDSAKMLGLSANGRVSKRLHLTCVETNPPNTPLRTHLVAAGHHLFRPVVLDGAHDTTRQQNKRKCVARKQQKTRLYYPLPPPPPSPLPSPPPLPRHLTSTQSILEPHRCLFGLSRRR